ncbi:MAG TPA: hypothetical protein ENH23_05995 [candidate division Zixibacteria bacterium]|nr:hypothetical protein [candidate division Zixibacteria bacterium]
MRINLASTRLAFVLIGLLLSLIVISAIIPQQDIAQNQIVDWQKKLGDNYKYIEYLKLDQIYTTPVFFIVIGLLAVNLFFGNARRFRLIYKTDRKLIQARHLGSIIFHLSLVLLLFSVVLNYLYKFEGILALTEGQSIVENRDDYTRAYQGPFYSEEYGRFKIKHIAYYPAYLINDKKTSASEISLQDSPNAPETTVVVTTNNPFVYNGLEFHYELQHGYSPEVIVIDSTGKTIFKRFIRLAIQRSKENTIHADYYILKDYNMKITIEATPRQNHIDSTLFNLDVEIDDNLLYQGTIGLDDTISYDGYKLVIPRLRNWCYYHIVKSPYLNLIFASFWLALIGMTIGLIPRVIGTKKK